MIKPNPKLGAPFIAKVCRANPDYMLRRILEKNPGASAESEVNRGSRCFWGIEGVFGNDPLPMSHSWCGPAVGGPLLESRGGIGRVFLGWVVNPILLPSLGHDGDADESGQDTKRNQDHRQTHEPTHRPGFGRRIVMGHGAWAIRFVWREPPGGKCRFGSRAS